MKIFPSTATTFNNNGYGILSDSISQHIREEINGEYELTFVYPVDGIHSEYIENRAIVLAKPNPYDQPQAFRIYKVSKPINGQMTVYAQHISYDLTGNITSPFTANSLPATLTKFNLVSSPFTFSTSRVDAGEMEVEKPSSIRSVMGGQMGGLLEVYGGEYEYNNYNIVVQTQRGTDRGVVLRYGKNIVDFNQEENFADVYTGVVPYYMRGDEKVIGDPVSVAGTFDYTRLLPVDVTKDFENKPNKTQVQNAGANYIAQNNIGVPNVSIKLDFVQLEQSGEFENIALLERVSLGDTVTVVFPKYGINTQSRVVAIDYDPVLEKYNSVEIGEIKSTLANKIANNSIAVKLQPSAMDLAITEATELITGNRGGYVVLHSSTGATQPDELLVMDSADIETAVNVWRWNVSGLGYSNSGYNGPYVMAWTINGAFNADFITTGSLNAGIITSGVLTSADGRVQFDLSAGTMTFKDASNNIKLNFDASGNLTISGTINATAGKIGGFTISGNNLIGSYVSLKPNAGGGIVEIGNVTLNGQSGLEVDAANTSFTGGINIRGGTYFEVDRYGNMEIYGRQVGMQNLTARSVTYSANLRLDTDTGYLYRISSSKRYKRNVHDIREFDSVGDRIDRVRAVTFESKTKPDAGRGGYGFIAEEMEQEFPWLTEYRTDKETGMIEAESVSYDRVPAVLWADAQETHKKIKELKVEIEELKKELEELKCK